MSVLSRPHRRAASISATRALTEALVELLRARRPPSGSDDAQVWICLTPATAAAIAQMSARRSGSIEHYREDAVHAAARAPMRVRTSTAALWRADAWQAPTKGSSARRRTRARRPDRPAGGGMSSARDRCSCRSDHRHRPSRSTPRPVPGGARRSRLPASTRADACVAARRSIHQAADSGLPMQTVSAPPRVLHRKRASPRGA